LNNVRSGIVPSTTSTYATTTKIRCGIGVNIAIGRCEPMTTEQKDNLGRSIKDMPSSIMIQRKKELETIVSEFSEELKRRSLFTPSELLADRIHNLLHFGEECDYNSSSWPHPSGCRREYQRVAVSILVSNNSETVNKILDLMEQVRFCPAGD